MEDILTDKKTEMSSLDLKFLARELKEKLIGGIFRKIYQYKGSEGHQFLFEIFKGENFWLYLDSNKVFVTEYKKASPQEPPSFCMFLRKHLRGQKIKNVFQHKFDRVIEIETTDNFLIIELFSKGNVILTDTFHHIIMPLAIQRWKDRTVKPKQGYKYPTSGMDPFNMDFDEFKKALQTYEKPIAAVLATSFGFGKEYANEICSIAKVDGSKISNTLNLKNVASIHKVVELIGKTKAKPSLYDNSVTPFPLKIYEEKEAKAFESFSAAVDEYFSAQKIQIEKQEKKEEIKKVEEKKERIVEVQKKGLEKWERIGSESKEIADLIYNNYGVVENVLNGLKKAKDAGETWIVIKERIEKEDTPEANAIKEIKEHEGLVILELGGKEIELDFNKSLEQNAERYYEDVKWAKKKLVGVQEAIEEKKGIIDMPTPVEEKPEIKVRKKWYEKYKWFISSSDFLVIAGRNAEQNETIVKKYAETKDLLFHADIVGAAFVLIKSDGKEIDDITIKEAAEFSAANSKAWIKGFGTVDVFAFKPEQATKPEGGLDKGSFVVKGERTWFKDQELKLSIGIKIDREMDYAKVISGPVMAVRNNSDYFITIKPGFKESVELIREIKNNLLLKAKPEDRFYIEKIPAEDFQGCIPSGKGDIVG